MDRFDFDSGNLEEDLTLPGQADEDSIWPTLIFSVSVFVVGALSTVGVEFFRSLCRGELHFEEHLQRICLRAWQADHKSIYKRPSIKYHMKDLPSDDRRLSDIVRRPQDLQMESVPESYSSSSESTAVTREKPGEASNSGAAGSQLRAAEGAGLQLAAVADPVGNLPLRKTSPRRQLETGHSLSEPAGRTIEPLQLPSPDRRHTDGATVERTHLPLADPLLATPQAKAVSFRPGSSSSSAPPSAPSALRRQVTWSGDEQPLLASEVAQGEHAATLDGRAESRTVTPPLAKKATLLIPEEHVMSQDGESQGKSDGHSSGGDSDAEASKTQGSSSIVPGLAAHTSYTNYLCFLKVCQAMFGTLSLLSVIFMIPRCYWWGFRPLLGGTIGGRISLVHPKNSFEPDLDQFAIVILYIQTWTYGVVVLIFAQLLQASCDDMPVVDIAVAEKINRTVWMRWLPTGDKRTRQKFLMSDEEFDRVADDLKYAIEERVAKMGKEREVEAASAYAASCAASSCRSTRRMSDISLQSAFDEARMDRPRAASIAGAFNCTVTEMVPAFRRHPVTVAGTSQRHSSDSLDAFPDIREEDDDDKPLGSLEESTWTDWMRPTRSVKAISGFFQSFGADTFAGETFNRNRTWRVERRQLQFKECVETVEVPPVTIEWHRTCLQLREASERADSYRYMESKHRILMWWYRRQAQKCTDESKRLRTQLLKITLEQKALCGCAFVTFSTAGEKEQLLSNDKPPSWWEIGRIWRGYSHFTFGRPPFASVTLKCEPAPHPDDIQWANLHKSPFERNLRFWTGVVLLTLFLVLLVTPNTLRGIFLYINRMLKRDRQEKKSLEFWFDSGFTSSFARVLNVIWKQMVTRLLSMLLLVINSLILPYVIQLLAEAEQCPRKSTVEQRSLHLNFMFMVLNIVLMPMLQVTSVQELMESLTEVRRSGGFRSVLGYVGDRMSRGHGVFTIQYLINATFLSSAVAMGSAMRQNIQREIILAFFAVTDRDRQESYNAELFTWGYWYAWALAIICMTLIICVLVPGTLPICTILFTMRYHVDRYNLDNSIHELGSESNGAFVLTVVHHMRLIASIMWFLMGCFFLTDTCKVDGPRWITHVGSYALCGTSVVIGLGNTFYSMYSFWGRKMVEMYDSETWMKRIRGHVGRSHSLLSRLLGFLQDKLQLTKLIAGSENNYGSAQDINWKVVENKEYIWSDSLVQSMLQVLQDRCREEGTFNFTTKNLERYGFETADLTDFFDIIEGDEETKSRGSKAFYGSKTRKSRRPESMEVEMGLAENWGPGVAKTKSLHF